MLSAFCGVLIFWWAASEYGGAIALICALLWFLDPVVMTNSTLATTDAGTAAFGLLATFLFGRFLWRPTFGTCAMAGVGLGLAEGSKFSLLALVPAWLVIAWTARHEVRKDDSEGNTSPPRFWVLTAAVFVFGIAVLNVLYRFEGTGTPLGAFNFRSLLLSAAASDNQRPASGNRFRGTILGSLPVPLPARYALGFDSQKWDEEQGFSRLSRGHLQHRGTWASPFETMFGKLPVGTLCLLALSLSYWCVKSRAAVLPEAIFALPGLAVLVVVVSQTGLNWAVRYLLPAYPFFFLATGRPIACVWRHPLGQWLVVFCMCWNGYSFINTYPFFHSFGNEFIGGPEGAGKRFIGSNHDWGQELLRLRTWSNNHPECRPLVVTYYGAMNPGTLSFEDTGVPMAFLPREEFGIGASSEVESRKPLYWAISSTLLNGLLANIHAENGYRGEFIIDNSALRPENAMTRIGHTIFIFRVAEKRRSCQEDAWVRTGYRLPTKTHRTRGEDACIALAVLASAENQPMAGGGKLAALR